jgi:hypothetical protein
MYAPAILLGLILTVCSARADEIAKLGDLELHCVAVPTTELTPEAAKAYNVEANPGRGLLTITLMKRLRPGEAKSVAGQVYAGAINQGNYLSTIPIREIRDGNEVYYLGEYRVNAPDTMRFLINANVLGKMMKSEFTRVFSAP